MSLRRWFCVKMSWKFIACLAVFISKMGTGRIMLGIGNMFLAWTNMKSEFYHISNLWVEAIGGMHVHVVSDKSECRSKTKEILWLTSWSRSVVHKYKLELYSPKPMALCFQDTRNWVLFWEAEGKEMQNIFNRKLERSARNRV